jgi:hypothetical protein
MDTAIELEIGPGPEEGVYLVRVLRSVGGGQPTSTFELDVDELLARRGAIEDSVLSSSVAARRIISSTEAAIQGVGRLLFDSVFTGEVKSAYRTSLAVASDRGKGLQVILRLTAPGLAALPWEALYDAETGIYLCRKEPLVRQVPAPYSPPALVVEPPLRILGMVSSPRGLQPLDVEHERDLLEEALRPHLESGRVRIDWIDEVTWPRVHDKLLEREWHVLHFIGHGTYDSETDEGVLAFVGRDGRADYVTASSLADLLHEAEPSPRLVLLNSCLSGAGGTDDLFSGTAAALVHSGIHAVAAMQYSISDPAAIEFARGFYAALARGRGIDEAVRSGRIGILGIARGTLEWVTPVLYLRGEGTRLFDVASAPEHPDRNASSPTADAPHTLVPARESEHPTRHTHAPDSGDIPATRIPIVHVADTPPSEPAAAPAVSTKPPMKTPHIAPAAAAAAAPDSAAPTPPTGAPPSRSPAAGVDAARSGRNRRKPWLVGLGLVVALLVVAAAVWAFLPRNDTASPSDDPSESAPADAATPQPRAVVTVPAAGPDVDTGVPCVAGEVVVMTATGTIDMDTAVADPLFAPDGYSGPPSGYRGVYPEHAPGALIGWVRTPDAVDVFGGFVEDGTGTGTYRAEHACPLDGPIWLGVNDPIRFDNAGGFDVTVW